MSINMDQFLQTFFEESFEGLDIMENGLLNLDSQAADADAINTIFRAAHSIKGGSATFGLNDIASFTHVMETLLDEVRDGHRAINQTIVDMLLQSVDCLREMMTAIRDKTDFDKARVSELQQGLENMLKSREGKANDDKDSPADALVAASNQGEVSGWQISFIPKPHLLRTGNDPLRLFRELALLGELEVKANTGQLPEFDALDPENIHLSWELTLRGDIPKKQIMDVFDWVDGDCELLVSPLQENEVKAAVVKAAVKSGTAPTQAGTDAAERRSGADRRSGWDRRTGGLSGDAGSIRVSTDKVDTLINMVGELVITQSMLGQLGKDFDMSKVEKLKDGLAQLERNTRELQENVMRIRMLPISFAFNRFPRMVHDLGQKLGKKVELKMSGENTELDKTVMEKIGDPLVHLVRNSMDHGIEKPELRMAAGKAETGTIHLNAYHQGGNIVISISDDGAGLNKERIINKARERGLVAADEVLSDEKIHELLFHPGFSTAEIVSDVSGRGVGMDVVRRNIRELGGNIDIVSEQGKGATFTIRLPLTLAILDGQLIRVGEQIYIVPLVSIIESLQVTANKVSSIAGSAELYKLRDDYLPIIRLYNVFSIKPDSTRLVGGLLVVVEGDGQKVGLFIDDLLSQQQVVIKSLETNFRRVDGVSGATILGDGTVALILDIPGLIRYSHSDSRMIHGKHNDNPAQVATA